MNFKSRLKIKIYNLIRIRRYAVISGLLDKTADTLLDIGCSDLDFYNKLNNQYKITLADYTPISDEIIKEDVQNLSFGDNKFDIVVCQQVLEHVYDPIKAIRELRRVAAKQLIITVPYEPFFTLARALVWEKNHLWAVTPAILKHYLGSPDFEATMILKRYYIGVWIISDNADTNE